MCKVQTSHQKKPVRPGITPLVELLVWTETFFTVTGSALIGPKLKLLSLLFLLLIRWQIPKFYYENLIDSFYDISETRSKLKWKIFPINTEFLLHFVWFQFFWLVHSISNLCLYMNVHEHVYRSHLQSWISSMNKFMSMFENCFIPTLTRLISVLYLTSNLLIFLSGRIFWFSFWIRFFLSVKTEIWNQSTSMNSLSI